MSETPKHLRPETRRWFDGVLAAYELEPHHVRLVQLAGEAWDRSQQAREVLDREGLTFGDAHGCPRARPEVAIERDSRIGFARMIRELRLDIESPADARIPRGSKFGLRVPHA